MKNTKNFLVLLLLLFSMNISSGAEIYPDSKGSFLELNDPYLTEYPFPETDIMEIENIILNEMCPVKVNNSDNEWKLTGINFESVLKNNANDIEVWSYIENNESISFTYEEMWWDNNEIIKHGANPSVGEIDNETLSISYPNAISDGINIIITQDNYQWQKIVEIESLDSLGNIPVDAEYLEVSFKVSGDFTLPEGIITDPIPIGENSFIQPVRAWDSSEDYESGAVGIITGNIITKQIPVEWLKSASYPVQTDLIITYGSENVFNAASTSHISVAVIDTTHFIVAYTDEGSSSNGTARIGTVSGNTITSYGTESVFNAAITDWISIALLNSTHFIIGYQDEGNSDNGTVIIGTFSGTAITSYGAESVFNAAITSEISVVKLSSTHFVAVYRDNGNSNYGTAIIGTFSGNTITSYGAENVFNTATTTPISATVLDSTHFVAAYRDYGNSYYGTAIIGTVSGTTISYGSEYVFNIGHTTTNSITAFDSTHFVVSYCDRGNSYYGTSIFGTVSGTTISYGAESVFNTDYTNYISVVTLDDTRFIVTYQDYNTNFGATKTGIVSGTTITHDTQYLFNSGSTYYISASLFSDTHFIIGYQDISNSSYGTVIVGSIPSTPSVPPDPTSLSSSSDYHWINWTWVPGSGTINTDSFNVSINNSWTNGSANTYYNHYLPSGGTSIIIVWAYNSSHGTLSNQNITDSNLTPFIPSDPINLTNSTSVLRVNFTFEAGIGNVADSFNIGTNNGGGIVWNNGSLNLFSNTSTSPHGYVDIIVYAYNSSSGGTLSTGYLTDNVTIPNNAISILNVTNYSINEFELLSIDANATDPDSDTPTFSCNRTDLFTDFNTATGTGNWTPSDIHGGNYSVEFGVNDGHGSTDIKTILIVVADTVDPNPGEGEGGIITWDRISDYPGDSTVTQGASPSFSIGRKGYAIANNQELWEFNADSGSWTQKTDVSSSPENPTYLTINEKGYVIGGVESGDITGKVREYTQSTNTWNEGKDEYETSGGATGVVLPVIEDGYVFKYAPDTNYSTPGPLYIGDNRNAYLKYDISGIPSNARITDITQYIYWNGHCSLCGIEGSPTYTRKTTSNWNSNTLTWNNQPTVQVSSITVYFHMWFNQPSIGSPASSHIQDSIDDGDSWYGTQITTFSEPGPNNNVYGSFNSIEDCAGCPELWKTLLPGSQIVVDWVPKLDLMVASFDIGDKGYTLTTDGNLQSYDQFSDSWQDHSSIPSSDDVTWAISHNGKGYALVGNTMWKYTQNGDDWSEMSSSSHFNTLEYPTGFVLEDTIYLGTGLLDGTKTASMFSFNPATDTWVLESTSFPSARSRAIAFSIENDDGSTSVYMGGGIGSVLHDFYEMGITPTSYPTSTPKFVIPNITLPIEEFEFPELEIPEVLKDTIFEEILVFIGKIFSWLFILAAYFGAFVASVILMRENEDLNDTKYSIFLFGTIGWIVPLIINFIGLLALVTQSFTLNVIIFAAFGFVSYAILNIFSNKD